MGELVKRTARSFFFWRIRAGLAAFVEWIPHLFGKSPVVELCIKSNMKCGKSIYDSTI